MSQNILQGPLGIFPPLPSTIQGLKKKIFKMQMFIFFRHRPPLRENKLQFLSGMYHQFGTRLGTDAKPIDPFRWQKRAVRFHCNFPTSLVEKREQPVVELQQGFPAG